MTDPTDTTPNPPTGSEPAPESREAFYERPGEAADSGAQVPLVRETLVLANDRTKVGVLVALCTMTGVGLGFGLGFMATPSHTCSPAARSIQTSYAPTIVRPLINPTVEKVTWLGVKVETYRHEDVRGAVVVHVFRDSPAEHAGIQPGQLLLAVDGVDIDSSAELVEIIRNEASGTEVEFTIRGTVGGKLEKKAAILKSTTRPDFVHRHWR